MVSYFFLTLGGGLTWLLTKLFLKLKITGRENVPSKTTGLMLVANHQSLADSFFIITFWQPFWRSILHPKMIPWNTPEAGNFFKTPLLKFIFKHLRCLPVKRNGLMKKAEIMEFFKKIKKILQSGNLLIFFEGTRTRSGEIGEVKSGVVKIIRDNLPTVIPIRIDGLSELMPIGAKGFKVRWLGKRVPISITIGKPMYFAELLKVEVENKTNAASIAKAIREAVLELKTTG